MKRLHGIVRGVVQGVGYRAHTQREAQRLGLAGWVRNLPDGAVEFLAEGGEVQLEALLDWARRGPRMAQVAEVHATWGEAEGVPDGFQVVF